MSEARNLLNKAVYPMVGFLIGVLAFMLIYGVRILNPFYVDWLLGQGDLSQHYLGWEFYRQDVWRFPIGMTNRLAYPIETSVIFTDSIPVLAVLFKAFGTILLQYFQYFGLWGMLCFGLQGYFAAKIFRAWYVGFGCALIGNIFLVLSPIMIHRMFMHTSLGGQWLLLAAIYLFLLYDHGYKFNRKKTLLYWGILGSLVAGIHLYFLPMCFLFAVGGAVKSVTADKRLKMTSFLPCAGLIFGVCCTFYILGGFSSRASGSGGGLGSFGFDLKAFMDGNGFSCILPDLQSGGGYEGFAYLGGGMICMGMICILSFPLNIRAVRKIGHEGIIVICITIVSILMAALPTITCGGKVLLDIKLPRKAGELYAVFRPTGRLVWPAWYLIVLYCIKTVAGLTHRTTVNAGVLAVCLLIQVFDTGLAMAERHERFAEETTYEYVNDDFWQKLSEYRNFRCVCFSYLGEDVGNCVQLGALALRYGWTLNAFYFARDIDGMRENETALEHEPPQGDCIYIFLPRQQDLMKELENELRYYHVGELVIGISWLDNEGNVNDFSYE